MYTIRELCKKSGLSRTALLYYESIGLLTAEARSESNYRLYSDDSVKRLERICTYRAAGVPLAEITQILRYKSDGEREILEKTLSMLNQKAREIKDNQEKIAALLHQESILAFPLAGIDIKAIMTSLAAFGIDESVFLQIHKILEQNSSENHRSFLNLCGFSEAEINHIFSALHEEEDRSDL